MTDDRPRSAAKPITVQTLELAHAHTAPDKLGLGSKIVLISGVDIPSELRDQLNAEAAKHEATVVVSPASPDTPNTVELKYVMGRDPGINDCLSGSGPSGSNGKSGASPDNWFESPEKPWLRKGFKKR